MQTLFKYNCLANTMIGISYTSALLQPAKNKYNNLNYNELSFTHLPKILKLKITISENLTILNFIE